MRALDREAILAIGAVALVTCIAAGRYAGIGLHAGDVVYLLPLEGITAGGEAPRPLRNLSWGLLHTLGHALEPRSWAAGHVGWPVSLAALGLIPWTAWVTARLARALGYAPGAVGLAAVLAALAPAALINAGTIDTLGRWLAAGTALLALAVAIERFGAAPRRRDVLLVGALQAVAVAWHPAAVTAPVLLGLVLPWTVPAAGRPRAAGAVALGIGAAVLWVALSRQGGIAAVGVGNLAEALWFQPVVAALMTAWQLPALGRLAPITHPFVGGAAILLLGVALVARPRTRTLGVVTLASLSLMLADGASVGFIASPVIAWTVGTTQSAMGAAVVASLLGAGMLWAVPRRTAVIGAVLVLALLRGVWLMDARRADADADARIQRLLAVQLLVPAAANPDIPPTLIGAPRALMEPLRNAKWVPELPPRRRTPPERRDLSDRVVAAIQGAPAGFDGAVWQAAVHRCELWLGLPRDLHGPCGQHPRVTDSPPTGWSCALDVRSEPWHPRCPPRPEPLSAAATRDPRALSWAILATLLLAATLVGVGYGRRGSTT